MSAHAPEEAGVQPVAASRRGALVVGASSGIGASIVRRLASEGYAVAALARRQAALDELERECRGICERSGGEVLVRAHDVVNAAEVPALFEELVQRLGSLELVVFAAGIMPAIGPDEFDTGKDLEILAVNLGGCVAWLNPTAEFFQSQRSGTIVGVSSIAGDRGRRGNPAYCTSKAAMNTYLEALRNRLGPHGVHVCTIRPGFVDTAMVQGMDGLFWLIGADQAAESILKAARSKANVRYVPFCWMWVGLVLRCIPSFFFRRLSI